MKLLSSDARNRTAEAISSGRPIRCIGVMAMNRSFIAPTFGPNWASRRGVSIGPGLTMLARMPLPANSAVHVRTNERRTAFVALYVEYIGIPFCQAPEPLTIIEPPVMPAPVLSDSGPACAENGSCFGDISSTTGRPKPVQWNGYYRSDGTKLRGYYRSA